MTFEEFAALLAQRFEEATDSMGSQVLPYRKIDDILHQYSPNTFGPVFCDEELAKLALNPKIDWLKAQVTSEFRGYPLSLLTILMSHMPMRDLITPLPALTEALNGRYTPDEQVSILKQSQVMPASVGRSIDAQQFLAGRIAPMIVQDKHHMDAWMLRWLSAIKGQEEEGKSLGVSFFHTMKPTAAYKRLEALKDGLQAMPFLMTMAAIIDQDMFENSALRYTNANLYQLSNPAFSGSFSNSQRDVYRSNLIFSLHNADEPHLASLITEHIGQAPIAESNIDVCSAMLATCVDWKESYLPIEELIVKESFGSRDAVDNLLWDYAFDWKENWFERLAGAPLCKVLKDEVAHYERFHTWVLRYAQHSLWGSLSSISSLPQWISMMNITDRERSFGLLVKKFESGITTRTQQYGSGIFYGKLLLSAFPDDPYTHATLNNQVGYLVKRALHDRHGELLTEVIKRGIIDYESVGPRIWDEDEFNCLTQHGWLDRETLMQSASNKTKREVIMTEFGI